MTVAEERAARLWGADWCRFSVAGSTHGNQALALAVGSPGQEVIVTRCLHRSLLLGLVLAGLRPVWVRPELYCQVRFLRWTAGGRLQGASFISSASFRTAACILIKRIFRHC